MDDRTLEFVGTATTILRLGPFTVLTDPNFLHRGQRAYLGKGLFSKRLTEPSIRPDELPRMDAVVLSHLHGDHFDRVARRALSHDLPILTTASASKRLSRWGFRAAEAMPLWEPRELVQGSYRLRLTAVPGQHAPGLVRGLLPEVMGTVLEVSSDGGDVFRMYVSGDTIYRPWLREIVDRLGPLDAAVLHLGGTRILGLLVTMDDKQGADLVELLTPTLTVPVHYDDYGVFRSPLRDFVATAAARQLPTIVRTVARGETISLA